MIKNRTKLCSSETSLTPPTTTASRWSKIPDHVGCLSHCAINTNTSSITTMKPSKPQTAKQQRTANTPIKPDNYQTTQKNTKQSHEHSHATLQPHYPSACRRPPHRSVSKTMQNTVNPSAAVLIPPTCLRKMRRNRSLIGLWKYTRR
jgi:hypothetical protein